MSCWWRHFCGCFWCPCHIVYRSSKQEKKKKSFPSRDFVDNICMVKTDVEGHDLVILRCFSVAYQGRVFTKKTVWRIFYFILNTVEWILHCFYLGVGLLFLNLKNFSHRDLEPWFRPQVLWVEWWRNFILEVDQYKGDINIICKLFKFSSDIDNISKNCCCIYQKFWQGLTNILFKATSVLRVRRHSSLLEKS